MRFSATTLLLPALCGHLSLAHFTMTTPKSIGFSDDDEGKAPCGGITPDLSKNTVDFHVGGDALGIILFHTQSNWLFRATTDEDAAGNWTQMFPVVQQSGAGKFCQPKATLPESWAGKKGFINVVSHAEDGLLYQCIAANFVKGTNSDTPSACQNASSVKVSFSEDSKLNALVGEGSDDATNTGSAPQSSATEDEGDDEDDAGSSLQTWSLATSMVTVLTMAVVGGGLLI